MKIKNIILSIGLCATLSGCIGDLDVTQYSTINSSNMWEDENDVLAAMYGMYYSCRNAFRVNLAYWGEMRSGSFGPGQENFGSYQILVDNSLSASTGYGTNWSTLYTCINDCNMVLKHVDDVSYSSESTREQILANAYYLRAYCYYYIVRIWGDAPLMLNAVESTSDNVTPERVDAEILYDQIASDLELSAQYMPQTISDKSIGNIGALNMLTCDFWLWRYRVRNGGNEALTKAETAVNAVINSGSFSLMTNYDEIFDVDHKQNSEIIFCIHFEKITESFDVYYNNFLLSASKYGDDSYYWDNRLVEGGSNQWYILSSAMQQTVTEYDFDQRAEVNIKSYTIPETGNTYTWINKFLGEWSGGVRYWTNDLPMYRYAEALLFKAEIENEKGGSPAQWLNQVAQRAYGKENFYSSALSHADMNEAIFNERQKEFAAEGKSWFDYIRMGYAFTKISSLVGRQNETNILLWPIATACFTDNPNMRQTVGYY